MINHGSLFSGIGGFDLAASWMGWNNVFSCEKDPFCRKILSYYWPNTTQFDDIYDFKATLYRDRIDVISGGFPCQPFSQAGRRKGTKDDRYLWPQAKRVIEEIRPRYVVLENVAGLFSILEPESLSEMEVQAIELFCSDNEQNSNSTILRLQRRVIGTIISEIRSAGYVLPQLLDGTPILLCIPACGVGAPHRRDRVWFVAHSRHIADRLYQTRPSEVGGRPQEKKTVVDKRFHIAPIPEYLSREQVQYQAGSIGPYYTRDRHAADTDSAGQQRSDTSANGDSTGSFKIPDWNQWPSQPPILGRNDGIPKHLDGITLSKWQENTIRGYGNAIVPQIAFELFRSIMSTGTLHP